MMVSPVIKQTWVITSVLISIASEGMVIAYSSNLLSGLLASDSPFHVDLDTASWIVSCTSISMSLGLFIASFLMEWAGRKKMHALTLLPAIFGLAITYFTSDVTTLVIARLLIGLTFGASLTIGSTVIGEYSCPENRGLYLNLKSTASIVGFLLIHILSSCVNWRILALIIMILKIIAFINTWTWPESPSWLISKNRFHESEISFYWLRGTSEFSTREFNAMVQAQKRRVNSLPRKFTIYEQILHFFMKCGKKDFYKPVIILFFAFAFLETTGRHFFPAFALDIMGEISPEYKTLSSSFIDLISLFSSLCTCFLIKKLRRRTLLFYSGIASLVVLFGICVYLFLVSNGSISNDRQWIPVSMFLVYFCVCSTGCYAIPLTLYGELFPLPHRGSGTAVAGLVMSISITTNFKVIPIMLASLRVHGTFAVMGLLTAFFLLCLYFTLPETRNRTLQEIEDYFNHGKFLDDVSVRANDVEAKTKMLPRKVLTETVGNQ